METNNTTKYTVRLNLYLTLDVPNDILDQTAHSIFGYALHDLAVSHLNQHLNDWPDYISCCPPEPDDYLPAKYWPA